MSAAISDSPLPTVASHAGAEFFCQNLRVFDGSACQPSSRILIAGCGAGHEAALIQQLLCTEVHAVDVSDELLPEFKSWPQLHYCNASVCDLPFEDGWFDAVFYHHVIEHVDNPAGSLVELSRVLKPGAWMFVGTPNRHRLVSSVGAHKQTHWNPTWKNKLGDNLHDWSARLRGKFRNEYGAHAGFSRRELGRMLRESFAEQRWVTKEYLQYKYQQHRFSAAVSLLASKPFSEFSAPSIYVFARNAG